MKITVELNKEEIESLVEWHSLPDAVYTDAVVNSVVKQILIKYENRKKKKDV